MGIVVVAAVAVDDVVAIAMVGSDCTIHCFGNPWFGASVADRRASVHRTLLNLRQRLMQRTDVVYCSGPLPIDLGRRWQDALPLADLNFIGRITKFIKR